MCEEEESESNDEPRGKSIGKWRELDKEKAKIKIQRKKKMFSAQGESARGRGGTITSRETGLVCGLRGAAKGG